MLYGQNILVKELTMSTNLDLKQTEKASYRLAAYADGTGDLSLGLVFILLGVLPPLPGSLRTRLEYPLFPGGAGLDRFHPGPG